MAAVKIEMIKQEISIWHLTLQPSSAEVFLNKRPWIGHQSPKSKVTKLTNNFHTLKFRQSAVIFVCDRKFGLSLGSVFNPPGVGKCMFQFGQQQTL